MQVQHKIGALVNAATGYVLDAGVILHTPEGTLVLHTNPNEPDGRPPSIYDPEDFPILGVLPFEFNPN